MPGMALPQVHPAAGPPEFSHHALGGVVLVGIQGCLVSTGELSCHRFGSIPISVAHRWLALAIDDQGMVGVHDHMPLAMIRSVD